MPLLATDWATISSMVAGIGTLVLAVATFASVRSSNRSARVAEAALQEQRRPVLAPSRLEDPAQKLMFVDRHWVKADGGRAVAEHVDGIVYLAISLRNVGSGIGVCQGWFATSGLTTSWSMPTHAPEEEFRLQTRDLYIPSGDIGFWQGAFRDPGGQDYERARQAIKDGETLTIDLLYGDNEGGQRIITRFILRPGEDGFLISSATHHWNVDRPDPR